MSDAVYLGGAYFRTASVCPRSSGRPLSYAQAQKRQVNVEDLLISRIFLYVSGMRILLQKVTSAAVSVEGTVISSIGQGYLLFLGVLKGDMEEEGRALAEKIAKVRLFDGMDGKINDRSLLDIGGSVLVVSQFTLAGDLKKGNRPDYTAAEAPERAEHLYEQFIAHLHASGITQVETGRFGAHMQVSLNNDGPVTLLLESR